MCALMARIPLEDNFNDVLGKAIRGLKLSKEQLAQQAGLDPATVGALLDGKVDEAALGQVAGTLRLGRKALLDLARKAYYPQSYQLDGLACFNTPYDDYTVNAYLVWDPRSLQGVVFDTGADAGPLLEFAHEHKIQLKLLLLTHTHVDHVKDLNRIKREAGVNAYVCGKEPIEGATPFHEGKQFTVGALQIDTRQTSGHSVGGITYVVSGLARPLAVVGDSIFAGSMGGGMISYADALENNRRKILSLPDQTVLCPGHGPLTTVGEEKQHNPFFPECQPN